MADHGAARRQSALVTGASRGIGAAIALQFARAGWAVGCLSRTGRTPHDEVSEVGERLISLPADLRDDDLASTLRQFVDVTGHLDVVVNCAGLHIDEPSTELVAERVREVMEVNFVAPLRLSQLAFPHLAEVKGSVVNIGSFYDRLGVPGSLAYSASKAALASATRTLAVEWGRHGVSVINVAPGYVHTDINAEVLGDPEKYEKVRRRIPVGRVGSTDDVASIVWGIVTSNRGFLSGSTIYIDGGEGISL